MRARLLSIALAAGCAAGGSGVSSNCNGGKCDDDDQQQGPKGSFVAADVYANLDTELGEAPYPDEEANIKSIIDVIETFLQRRYDEGRTDERGQHKYLRDAHAKADGCVKG